VAQPSVSKDEPEYRARLFGDFKAAPEIRV